jgi:branched-chain amino acid transport system permease protein
VLQTYVPARWGELPAILFGLGAIGVAKNPEGAVLHTGRQIRHLLAKIMPHQPAPLGAITLAVDEATPPPDSTDTQPAAVSQAGTPASMMKAKP